jgi:SOS response regulatory protein OraA/RecX
MTHTKMRDISALPLDAQAREAQKRTEMLIRVRDRSEHELAERLKRAGFNDAVIKKETARAVAAGLVDDERFINLYIAGKKRSGWGHRRIESELKRFGIDLRHRDGYLEKHFNDDDELERALLCLSSFKTNAKDKYAACYRKLLSKGFSNETTTKALASYHDA